MTTDPTTEAPEQPTEQPALTRGVIAGVISAVVLLLVGRANRSWDILDTGELDQFKALVALGAPALAGWLISRHVVPAGKADRAANFFMNAGYAQGLVDKQAEHEQAVIASPTLSADLKSLGSPGEASEGGLASNLAVGDAQPPTAPTLAEAQAFADSAFLVDEGFLAYITPFKPSA